MATTTAARPLKEIAASAEIVVEGTIVGVRYDLVRDAPPFMGLPFTAYTLDVTEALRGAPGNEIDLVYAGGSFDGVQWATIAGAPQFEIGEHVLVHATDDGKGGYRMVSWTLGILRRVEDSGGREVAVDGRGRPLAAVACDTAPSWVLPPPPASRADDDSAPPEPPPANLADSAVSWSEAVETVRACISANPYAGGIR
jgi:hypothetical protein